MRVELVIATYQKPDYLRLALSAAAQQQVMPDRICVADDGSDGRTRDVLAEFAALPLRHVWQADQGFRKTAILNEAVRSSDADFMVFIDDDCLMHPRFIARYVRKARRDRFLTGSVIRLGSALSVQLLQARRVSWTAGRLPGWQPEGWSERLKAMPLPPGVMGLLDAASPIRKSWAGGNAGTFRDNILRVNGFDEGMAYGGEDKEFGIRLNNAGIRGATLRYSAPLYHLDHARGYVDPAVQRRNRVMIAAARDGGIIWTDRGIKPTGKR